MCNESQQHHHTAVKAEETNEISYGLEADIKKLQRQGHDAEYIRNWVQNRTNNLLGE